MSTAGRSSGAARACEAVPASSTTASRTPACYHLLANELALLDRDPIAPAAPNALAFRLEAPARRGFRPQPRGLRVCGEREHLVGFSGAAGGVVCGACEANAFPLEEEAHALHGRAPSGARWPTRPRHRRAP